MIALFFSVMAHASPNCMTSACHASLRSAPVVHSPIKAANSCVVCHKVESSGPGHPKLVKIDKEKVNGICLTCHENLKARLGEHGQVVHPAIEKNTCIGCHDPHKSKGPHLIDDNPNYTLCLGCHSDIADKQEKAAHHKIDKMEKGCLSCHSPHSAPNAKLLVKVPPELCLSCHDKEIHEKEETIPSIKGFFVGHVHAPVSKGECYKCHQIHGSKADFLLQKSYSPSLYDPFTTSNFELCFQCHKKALAETRNTTTDTNFRNGDLNLHALHLANQSKQRTCRACHEIHSSTQARLIRDAFTYKDIQLPIQYTPSDQGGKCATACHHDMIYNRDKAFKNERQ